MVNPKLSLLRGKPRMYAQSTQQRSFRNLAIVWPTNQQKFCSVTQRLAQSSQLRASAGIGKRKIQVRR
jgi:hypothetical protein